MSSPDLSRRRLLAGATAASVIGMLPRARAATDANVVAGMADVAPALDACRVRQGACRGAYAVAPGGAVVWYFANLALALALPAGKVAAARVRNHLDLYLSRLESGFVIRDVPDPSSASITIPPDSHDAYASTLLTLACRHAEHINDWSWLRGHAALLKDIAYANLALPQKPGGLVGCFQHPGAVGYLKDNCENWQGLDSLQRALQRIGDQDHAYFGLVAQGVLAGITSLFDDVAQWWHAADVATAPGFYPDLVCQVYAEALSVPVVQSRKDAGYARLNLLAPGWEDGSYDYFPWMMLGAVAAGRGDVATARAQQRMCQALYAADPSRVTCNELGWYARIDQQLA